MKTIRYLTTSFFLASLSGSSVDAFLFTEAGFSLAFFCASRKAEISSGQSRFSSGSQVLSALSDQDGQIVSASKNSTLTHMTWLVNNKEHCTTPYQGSTCSSAGCPEANSLCKSFPLQVELYFAIDYTLVEDLLYHKLLRLLLGFLRLLLPLGVLLLAHAVHCEWGAQWENCLQHQLIREHTICTKRDKHTLKPEPRLAGNRKYIQPE